MSEFIPLEIKLPVEQTCFMTKSGSIQKDLHEFVTEWDSIWKSRSLKEQDFEVVELGFFSIFGI